MGLIHATFMVVRGLLSGQAEPAAENLALRQQLAVRHRNPGMAFSGATGATQASVADCAT